jgi:hypothetical protein
MHRFFKIANALTLMVFVFSGYAFAADAARITPSGKVSVYRAEKLVDELSAEAPLPFESLLVCSGECWVHMDSLYIAASDQSTFYVKASPIDKQIVLVKGFYYFSLTELSKQWVFKTPIEDVTMQRVLFPNDTSSGRLDGYIFVKDETIEIGVLEGGTLIVASSHGEHALEPGKQITVAKVGPQSEMVERVSADDEDVRPRTIVIWGLVGAGIIAGAAALGGGSGDNPPPASPSSP